MSDKKPKGIGKVNNYTRYKNSATYAKNKEKKLLAVLKKQPNNGSILKALGNISSYSRKAPRVQQWSKTRKYIAELYALFKKVPNKLTSTYPNKPNAVIERVHLGFGK